MIVKTDFVKPTGKGNPVFSKQAELDSFKHVQFHQRDFVSVRGKEAAALKKLPEEIRGENEFLPSILQKDVEASSTNKLDKIMRLVQDNMRAIQAKSRSRSEVVNANK